jgi:hypothetical protein
LCLHALHIINIHRRKNSISQLTPLLLPAT